MGFRRAGSLTTTAPSTFQTSMKQGILLCISCFYFQKRRVFAHILYKRKVKSVKMQWSLILSIVFAIIIAVFAILNIESVQVNYLFGKAHLPLILVILFTALLGAAISGFIAMFRSIRTNRQISDLKKEMTAKEITIATQQNEIAALQHLAEPALNEDKFEGEI